MEKAVEAIYANGVLQPLEKLDLQEGTHLTLLLLDPITEDPCAGYRYLVAREHPWRRQPYLRGRNLTVGQLVYNMRADHLSPDEAARRYDLPLEAIQETVAYYQDHRELIESEAEAEKQYLQEKGYRLAPENLS